MRWAGRRGVLLPDLAPPPSAALIHCGAGLLPSAGALFPPSIAPLQGPKLLDSLCTAIFKSYPHQQNFLWGDKKVMGQARLPSGELIDTIDVTSVTPSSTNTGWQVDVSLKNGETIAIACASERDLQETLKRVGRLLDQGAAP